MLADLSDKIAQQSPTDFHSPSASYLRDYQRAYFYTSLCKSSLSEDP